MRDVGLAEELAQDALVAALEQWPRVRHAGQSRRLADGRREASGDRRLPPQQLRERKHEQLGYELEVEQETGQPDLDAASTTTSATICSA